MTQKKIGSIIRFMLADVYFKYAKTVSKLDNCFVYTLDSRAGSIKRYNNTQHLFTLVGAGHTCAKEDIVVGEIMPHEILEILTPKGIGAAFERFSRFYVIDEHKNPTW